MSSTDHPTGRSPRSIRPTEASEIAALSFIDARGRQGCTSDELADATGMLSHAAAARLSKMEQQGWITRLAETRETRSEKAAHPYCTRRHARGQQLRLTPKWTRIPTIEELTEHLTAVSQRCSVPITVERLDDGRVRMSYRYHEAFAQRTIGLADVESVDRYVHGLQILTSVGGRVSKRIRFTMPKKKTETTKAKAPAAKVNKTQYIRDNPDLSAKDLIAKAKKEGITLTAQQIYTARAEWKKKQAALSASADAANASRVKLRPISEKQVRRAQNPAPSVGAVPRGGGLEQALEEFLTPIIERVVDRQLRSKFS